VIAGLSSPPRISAQSTICAFCSSPAKIDDIGVGGTKTQGIARGMSILGHPALLTPLAAWAGLLQRGTPFRVLLYDIALSLIAALAVLGLTWLQVRRGHWQHVDASQPHERRQLHRFTALLSIGMALLLWPWPERRALAGGLAISGLMVVTTSFLLRWLKVSLHMAFATFSACLLWPCLPAMLALLGFSLAVAWSRLALHRHVVIEVLCGALLGLGAGALLMGLAGEPANPVLSRTASAVLSPVTLRS
jgi:membrane-associated phospholipid phosphatase